MIVYNDRGQIVSTYRNYYGPVNMFERKVVSACISKNRDLKDLKRIFKKFKITDNVGDDVCFAVINFAKKTIELVSVYFGAAAGIEVCMQMDIRKKEDEIKKFVNPSILSRILKFLGVKK